MSLALLNPGHLTGVNGGRARINRVNKRAARFGIYDDRQRKSLILKVRRDLAYDKTRVRSRISV